LYLGQHVMLEPPAGASVINVDQTADPVMWHAF
jgi:hypothetical protein